MTDLVIAVDGIRRGRGGPFVAAAVAFHEPRAEPRFHFVDGRGVRREAYLFRRPELVKEHQVRPLAVYIRRETLGVAAYCLNKTKAPKNADEARLLSMFWAVKKLADRLRHHHGGEELRDKTLRLLVGGPHLLNTRHFEKIAQHTCMTSADWRLQVAQFTAYTAFPELT